jgi:hypothetical protein
LGKYIKKTKKTQKNQKAQRNPLGWVKKKPGIFQPCLQARATWGDFAAHHHLRLSLSGSALQLGQTPRDEAAVDQQQLDLRKRGKICVPKSGELLGKAKSK